MEWIDTHAHIYDPVFDTDLSQVLANCQRAKVVKIYLPNIDTDTIAPMLALEAKDSTLFSSMIGIHPCHIQQDFVQKLYQVESWLTKHQFVGIGEIGMDLYRDRTYEAQQAEAFDIQLMWARAHQLPVVIHTRKSFSQTLRFLERHQDGTLRGIVHCFSGNLREAQQVIELGFYVGIGGLVTFKNATLAKTVAQIGLQHIVLETDSPYLAPGVHRGQRNEPAYLVDIAAQVATLQGVDLAEVAAATTANARAIFERA
ncbi:MAG: TatD family hydrolase [Bacteroidota bacterium]